jgi:hypothetical protein
LGASRGRPPTPSGPGSPGNAYARPRRQGLDEVGGCVSRLLVAGDAVVTPATPVPGAVSAGARLNLAVPGAVVSLVPHDLTREPAMTAPVRRQTSAQWARIHAAARQARQLYPGPVGELVARELISYAELGWLVPEAMVEQVTSHIETAATAAGHTPEEGESPLLTSMADRVA